MIKKNLFICMLVSITFFSYGQKIDYLTPYLIKYQKVAFVKVDTVINFMSYIEESGDFYFSPYTLDTLSLVSKVMYSINNEKVKKRLIQHKETSEYDTIESYFPTKNVDYKEHSKVNIADEVRFSYILDKLNEDNFSSLSSSKMIRFVYPCDEINLSNSYYLVRLIFFNNSAKMISTFCKSKDISGIQATHTDSFTLKRKEIKKIEKILNVIEKPYLECSSPGNPWLIESNLSGNYKYYIISYDCCQRGGDRELEPLVNLYYLLRSINRKYFGDNCP